MAYASATFPGAPPLVGRAFAFPGCRWIFGRAAVGLGTATTAAAFAAGVTLAAVWIVGSALSANPHIHARKPFGPASLTLANAQPSRTGAANAFNAASIWYNAAYAPHVSRAVRRALMTHEAVRTPAPPPRPVPVASVPHAPERLASVRRDMAAVPLPRSRPALPASPKVEQTAPEVVASIPPAAITEKRPPAQHAPAKSKALPTPDSRTAVYDITAHTVYMPDGERLEAHSGLGRWLDDPRAIKVKSRGPTPPNVYRLTLRERLFHGVRAIRLTPVDDTKMFGRDGMLAHTYMLGPSGQSNGCVSFKDYRKFLTAFLQGKVERLIVVPRHGVAIARAKPSRDSDVYAFNIQ